MEHEIEILDEAIQKTGNILFKSKRENIRKQMLNLLNKRAVRAQIRSRAKYIEGEKSTSYFLRLETQRQTNNKITMFKKAGECITDSGGIIKECSEFYKNLYVTKNPNMKKINDYMSTCKLSNHLTEDQKDLCDKPISLKECTQVVEKCMKTNKSQV